MSSTNGYNPNRRCAFTLVEAVAAMAIMVVLLGGMSSAVFIASRAIDDGTDPATITGDATQVVATITDDLTFALSFRELTSTAVTFTVPDRDGDSLPELIRYAWSGTAGDPLTRAYNYGSPVAITEQVDELAFGHLLRTITPPDQACCQPSGTCVETAPDACALSDGTPMGPNSTCAATTCPIVPALLLVVTSVGGETATELARMALIETWGYAVTAIAATATQGEFDAALASADVAYVSEEVDAAAVANKLTGAGIGVVNEHSSLGGGLGFSSGVLFSVSSASVTILDNTHYITSPLALGDLTICSSTQSLTIFGPPMAPGSTTLAQIGNNNDTLVVMDAGATMADATLAAGRRVQLPWGRPGFFDFSTLNTSGQSIMQRALDWAAGREAAVAASVCGNAICEAGEDCNSCSADCAGVLSGKASGQYCCGNGTLEAAEGDGTICDGNP